MAAMKRGGGFAAIAYTLRMANRVGWPRLWRAMSRRNTCKTCALGMGGQQGGMRNELGHWPEVCKKSLQAMVADMQAGLEPEFFQKYSIAQLQSLSPRDLEWCGRLTQPLRAAPGDTHYRPLSWDEALDRIARQLQDSGPEKSFFYCSGRSSNEAAFLLQLFARLFGANYVNNCSYYCHQASGVGLAQALGTGTATVSLEDVEETDAFVLIGGNPASNHPRLMRTLMNIRRRGGEVVVVNPLRELGLVNFSVPSDWRSLLFGSPIASLYLQPHIGGDVALLAGVAKLLLERRMVDQAFVANHTEGFDAFAADVRQREWGEIERASGVSREEIERLGLILGRAKKAVFGWTMGVTHHLHGVDNVRMIVNVALLRGLVGKPQSGLLPIRGHSNVQGIGSMGVAPQLKESVLNNLEAHLGVSLPRSPGLDTMACMRAAAEGRMETAFCLGGNLFGSNPDAKFAHRALGRLKQVVYINTSLNTGHAWGCGQETLILPALARDEEPQPTTQESMFNFVRLSDGGPARVPQARSEADMITALARRTLGAGGPLDWEAMRDMPNVRAIIGRIVPGYEAIAKIDATKQEFHIAGRVFHAPKFPTESGKARFADLQTAWDRAAAAGRPDGAAAEAATGRGEDDGGNGDGASERRRPLRLMTIRSEGQFNTVVYEEQDIYRGQECRDIILMNAEDVTQLGLAMNQRVRVKSRVGEMRGILVREGRIRAGNAAMYCPEANVLVPHEVDPQSFTPAFKSVWVTVEAESAGTAGPHGERLISLSNLSV